MPSYRSPKETVRNGMQTVNENLSYPIPYPRFHRHQSPHGTARHKCGRLTKEKAFHRMIAAWMKVYRIHPEWQLDIYGEGEEKKVLLHTIKALGLEGVVRIHLSVPTLSKNSSTAPCFCYLHYMKVSDWYSSKRWPADSLYRVRLSICPGEIIHHNKDGVLLPDFDNCRQMPMSYGQWHGLSTN